MKKLISIILSLSILLSGIYLFPAKAHAKEMEFDYLGSYSEGYAVAGVWKGLWNYGYINEKGNIVIEPKYNFAADFREGLAIVGMKNDSKTMKYGYINTKGSYVLKPQYDYLEAMGSQGVAKVGIKDGEDYKYGIVDRNGNILVDIKYDYIMIGDYSYNHGLVELRNNNLHGIYNLKTKKLTEPKYNQIIMMGNYAELINGEYGAEKYGFYFINDTLIEPSYEEVGHYNGMDNVIAKVKLNGKYGILGVDGEYLIEPRYDEIREFNDGTSQLMLGGKYGFMDSDGSFLTKVEYDEISAFHKGMADVRKDGKWGVINRAGTYVVEPIYDQVNILSDKIEVISNGEKKILDLGGGSKYTTSDYDSYLYPYESIKGASVVIKNGKQVVIDSNGKPVFHVDFDKISEFENGIARIELNGKMGYLGKDGEYVIPPVYDGAQKNSDNSYQTSLDGLYGIILEDGTVIKPMSSSPIEFSNNYGIIRVDGKNTYIDKTGKRISSELFDDAYAFSDGMARVQMNSKYSYINASGKRMSKEYIDAYDFSEGYACVKDGQDYRYIDKNGNYVFGEDAKFTWAKSFQNGLAAVDNKKWGYINTDGKLVIEFQFDGANYFDKELAPVKIGDKFGFIDKTGKIKIKAEYDYATEFENGIAGVWKGQDYYSITSKGKITKDTAVKNTNFKFTEGIAPVKVIYNDIYLYHWGFLREDGSWLMKPELDYAGAFNNGEGYFYKDNKLGYVDKSGNIRWK